MQETSRCIDHMLTRNNNANIPAAVVNTRSGGSISGIRYGVVLESTSGIRYPRCTRINFWYLVHAVLGSTSDIRYPCCTRVNF